MKTQSNDIALIKDGETIYRATSPHECAPLESAPVVLIQSIYDLKPEQARHICRQRIYTTCAPSESVSGIVKVAAKRITSSLSIDDENLKTNSSRVIELTEKCVFRPKSPSFSQLIEPSSASFGDTEWMAAARSLAAQIDRSGPRYASDRPVAAILVSSENKILATSINTNAKNRTLHSEMNLISFLPEYRIPSGSRLYVTLKPCKMCAGMICDSTVELESLRVIYDEDDPGPRARSTALDRCPHSVQSQLIRD